MYFCTKMYVQYNDLAHILFRKITFQTKTIQLILTNVRYFTYPSPSKCILVSLHKGKTIPMEQLLLDKTKHGPQNIYLVTMMAK